MSLNSSGPRLIGGSSLRDVGGSSLRDIGGSSLRSSCRSPELLQERVYLLLVQVLVVVEAHLHARAAAARREALDAAQREPAIGRGLAVADAELVLEVPEQPVRTHQRARQRHADLKMVPADG